MMEDTLLLQKRAEIKRQLAGGKYKVLAAGMLDGTGRLIQMVMRRRTPLPFWYNGLVITLVILIIAFGTSILLAESPTLEMMLISIWGATMGYLVLTVTYVFSRLFLSRLKDSVVEAIESIADLESLQNWLTITFDLKKQFIAALLMGLTLGLATPFFWSAIRGAYSGWGPVVGVALIWFQGGLGWYFVFPVLVWLTQLDNYHFKLYAANPSSSEIILRLSDLLNNLVYAGAVLGAIFTLGLIYFQLLNRTVSVLFMFLGTWAPLIILFTSSQYTLARLITAAKWDTLSRVQTEIEKLTLRDNILDKETFEAVNRLMDYHDRIRTTRNSALDLRAGLNFLNSLLLPLLAFVLANIDRVLAFFT